jgi:hypothetical protein
LAHPQWPELTIADVWQDEVARLMPCPRPFDGYVELTRFHGQFRDSGSR